jgi:hypothetical protein
MPSRLIYLRHKNADINLGSNSKLGMRLFFSKLSTWTKP